MSVCHSNKQYSSSSRGPRDEGLVVDLRSDTVTLPTPAMRTAMAQAVVGDDVLKEDPTVIELEERVAKMMDKEAALYVPSGTMANLIACLVHCQPRGSEAIVGSLSHIFMYEQGNLAQMGGIHTRTLPTLPDGTFDLALVKPQPVDDHCTSTELICIENTQNNAGGKVLPMEWLTKLWQLSADLSLPVHCDGARIMNAAIALDRPICDLVAGCTTVNMCLSKGIGAPIGSILVGPSDFIIRARRTRKALGGGMRQVGVIAAAAIQALEGAEERIRKDHDNAKTIAEGLKEVPDSERVMVCETPQTNMVYIRVVDKTFEAEGLVRRLAEVSNEELAAFGDRIIVKCYAIDKSTIRLVTNGNVTEEMAILAARKLQFVVRELLLKN